MAKHHVKASAKPALPSSEPTFKYIRPNVDLDKLSQTEAKSLLQKEFNDSIAIFGISRNYTNLLNLLKIVKKLKHFPAVEIKMMEPVHVPNTNFSFNMKINFSIVSQIKITLYIGYGNRTHLLHSQSTHSACSSSEEFEYVKLIDIIEKSYLNF